MEDKIVNIITVILVIGIYIGLPVLLYFFIYKIYKGRKKMKQKIKKNKIFSIPTLILNAIPAFMITLNEQGEVSMDVEKWYAIMGICFAIVVIITIIQCKWSGIWISIVRFITGTAVGIIAGSSVILLFGFILVVGVISCIHNSRSKNIVISIDGKLVTLSPGGQNDIYHDSNNNIFRRMDNGTVLDKRNGETYIIL